MWRPIGIPFEGDGRHGYNRALAKSLIQFVIFRLAFRQTKAPAVIVDHDGNVIRIVEGRCAAIERGIIEVPLRRSQLPDELRKIVPVSVITCAAAFCRKIKLVPPFELSVWWQRRLAGFLTADQITADRNDPLAAFRPKHRHDVGGARAPIEASDDRFVDLEGIHKIDNVDSDHGRLPVPKCIIREKTRSAVAAQVRYEHVVTLRCQQRSNVDKAVNVVGPAVQENHGSTIGGTCFNVADVEETCIDLLDGPEGTIRARYVLRAGL